MNKEGRHFIWYIILFFLCGAACVVQGYEMSNYDWGGGFLNWVLLFLNAYGVLYATYGILKGILKGIS